jgi:hypothetical protein
MAPPLLLASKIRTSAYFRKMAELCRKANRLAPEMLPALRQHTASGTMAAGHH